MEPSTLWQEQDGLLSGMAVAVRAAEFTVGGSPRGGVTLTVQVPRAFWQGLDEHGVAATLLLNPDEARGIAGWLDTAAETADAAGPPLYSDQ